MTESETTCYKLTFNTDTFESMYKIDTTGVNYLAVFAEHEQQQSGRSAAKLRERYQQVSGTELFRKPPIQTVENTGAAAIGTYLRGVLLV